MDEITDEKLLNMIMKHAKGKKISDIKLEHEEMYVKQAIVFIEDGGKLTFSFSKDRDNGNYMLDITYNKDGVSIYI